jgi:hypothetical protein
MDYPGVKWSVGVTRVANDDTLASYATFIGDKSLVGKIIYI